VATPLQSPRTRSGLDRRCANIRISRVYPQVISPGIYSLTRREKTQNPGFDILNLSSRKFWKIFENTLLYITVDSFGSGGGGGGGEGFYIRLWCGGRGMRFDHHSYPSNGCNVLWRRFVHENRGGPTPVTD